MGVRQRSWKPTNKWMAAQCTATATLAVSWVNAGGVDQAAHDRA